MTNEPNTHEWKIEHIKNIFRPLADGLLSVAQDLSGQHLPEKFKHHLLIIFAAIEGTCLEKVPFFLSALREAGETYTKEEAFEAVFHLMEELKVAFIAQTLGQAIPSRPSSDKDALGGLFEILNVLSQSPTFTYVTVADKAHALNIAEAAIIQKIVDTNQKLEIKMRAAMAVFVTTTESKKAELGPATLN